MAPGPMKKGRAWFERLTSGERTPKQGCYRRCPHRHVQRTTTTIVCVTRGEEQATDVCVVDAAQRVGTRPLARAELCRVPVPGQSAVAG